MASSPISPWEIEGDKVKQLQILISWLLKSLWMMNALIKLKDVLFARKTMINLESILKSRDTTLANKICLVKATVFPVVMYGCASWTIRKAEHKRTDAFELWCWRRLLALLGLQGQTSPR